MKNSIRRWISILLVTIATISSVQMTFADTLPDVIEREEAVDQFIMEAMDEYNIPGVTLSIVKNGALYYTQGYGYSDLEQQKAVDPNQTIFAIASTTKLFTATSIMKLYEEGRIGLDDEVNMYLKDFKIDYYKAQPITIRHLLTHTAGFDERIIQMMSKEFDTELGDLGTYLKQNMPEAIREPGRVMQYSNHGMTVLGYIVEEVSGMRIDHYMEQTIFEPLGMDNTYYEYSPVLKDQVSKGYRFDSEVYIELPLARCLVHPAGAMMSTATDMAKFMTAHMTP